jgi:S-adenosylmethionine decarboxylase
LKVSPPLENVTRSLAINTYQLREFDDRQSVENWFHSLEQRFSVGRLSAFITMLGTSIGAKILNVSSTPYEPYGASAALLVGQEQHHLAHLDASHIAAHSYFDASDRVAQFRLEIEISTCGPGHPSSLIETVLKETDADFAQLDYRVRGLVWRDNGEPALAGDKLPLEPLELLGYEPVVQTSTGRGGCYVELTRVGLNREAGRLVELMKA